MNHSIAACVLAPLLALCPGATPGARAERPYQEVQRRESWLASLFLRPAEPAPGLQLDHARALRDAGRQRRAKNQYRALVSTWPASVEAPLAQYEWARILEDQGNLDDAFEQYQTLIQRFTGRFDFDEVIRRQFDIAQRRSAQRSFRIVFGGFRAPERALPMYEQILTNAPAWKEAADVRFRIGTIHEEIGDLNRAVDAYGAVLHRDAGAPRVEEAARRRVGCLLRLSRKNRNDVRVLDEAWFATIDYIARFPDSDHAARMAEHRAELLDRRAQNAYDAALYYDRQRRSPEIVRTAYERFLEHFPNTQWSETVRNRLAELPPAQENPSP